jgi:hypothetical protein
LISYVVVGGGAGGARGFLGSSGGGGGGGGGGGIIENSSSFISGSYTIKVGGGGLGGDNNRQYGINGENSSITGSLVNIDASGGFGGSLWNGGASGTPGSTGGIGNMAISETGTLGGGGGGAGYTGSGGNGSINNSTLIYGTIFGAGGGGGGGGSLATITASGGNLNAGVGGNKNMSIISGNGVENTGGGGGGGSNSPNNTSSYFNGGNGGSGVVILLFDRRDASLNNTTIGPITLSGATTYSVRQVTSLQSIPVILGPAGGVTTNNIYIPIHLQSQSSSTATNIRTISSKITNNSSTVNGPSISFNGFSSPLQSLTTVGPTNGISLTSTQIGDVSNISGGMTPVLPGYFLYSYITSQISSVSSPYQYTFSVLDQTNLISSSEPYYYESQPGNVALASGGSFSITNIDANYNISGLKIFSSGTGLGVSTSLSGVINIGKYYCYNGDLVTYTNTTGTVISTEPDFTDANATSGGTWYLTDANNQNYINPNGITFTLASLSITLPSPDTSFSITATINGIGNSTQLTKTVNANLLIDLASYNLVYNTFKQSYDPSRNDIGITADVTNINMVTGYRIYSVNLLSDPSRNIYTTNGTFMYLSGYNNSISIAGGTDICGNNYNTSMLVSKGGLITRGYDTSAFINYSTYYGNSFNYSSIASDSNIRYATFAWRIINPSSGSYTRILVDVTFETGTVISSAVNGFNGPTFTANGSNIILYYRTEDISNPVPPTINNPANNASSVWVNGNTTSTAITYSTVSQSNYFNGSSITTERKGLIAPGSGSGSFTDTNGFPYIRFKLIVPTTSIGTTGAGPRTKTLYIQIGATNSANFKITNVKAQLAVS